MMFGSGEVFEYLECGACGCLQISRVPDDLARHYPRNRYYSHKAARRKRDPAWRAWLRRARAAHYLGEASVAGALVAAVSNRPVQYEWLRAAGARFESRILDVGCGSGELLLALQRDGFRSLLGVDPYIDADLDHGGGVRVLRRGIDALEGEFDLVMLHHSFEHLPDPRASLARLARHLAPGGTLLLRVPVADSHARRTYGIDWYQWDAPRHLFLHTRRSIERLASDAGLRVASVVHDSSAQQFTSSELYRRGVPYTEHGRYRPGAGAGAFSREEWNRYRAQAEALNRAGEGDSAAFFLKRA